jgi:hypothetical protein
VRGELPLHAPPSGTSQGNRQLSFGLSLDARVINLSPSARLSRPCLDSRLYWKFRSILALGALQALFHPSAMGRLEPNPWPPPSFGVIVTRSGIDNSICFPCFALFCVMILYGRAGVPHSSSRLTEFLFLLRDIGDSFILFQNFTTALSAVMAHRSMLLACCDHGTS